MFRISSAFLLFRCNKKVFVLLSNSTHSTSSSFSITLINFSLSFSACRYHQKVPFNDYAVLIFCADCDVVRIFLSLWICNYSRLLLLLHLLPFGVSKKCQIRFFVSFELCNSQSLIKCWGCDEKIVSKIL